MENSSERRPLAGDKLLHAAKFGVGSYQRVDRCMQAVPWHMHVLCCIAAVKAMC
jgi:hypothetical protein